MEYNSTRDKLLIPEYGRNVQKMINHALTIEDRERRTSFVNYIAGVMTQMHISSGSYGDYNHMIWDHIHIIANYKMDVDCPYPVPDKEAVEAKPKRMKYAGIKIKYKAYGANIEKMIALAITYEEGDEKNSLVETIANHLKKAYLSWNRDSVDNDLILQHLSILSNGKLILKEDFVFDSIEDIVNQRSKKKWVDNRTAGRSTNKPINKLRTNKPFQKRRTTR